MSTQQAKAPEARRHVAETSLLIIPELNRRGYLVTYTENGTLGVYRAGQIEDDIVGFMVRTREQITDELGERLIDGYPYDVGGEGQSTAKQT